VPFQGALSPTHWLIVGLVALLVLGPEHIPEMARRFGQVMRGLREVESRIRDEVSGLVDQEGER
jgi:sec-independent protein translocase protein TatA